MEQAGRFAVIVIILDVISLFFHQINELITNIQWIVNH